MIQKLLGSLERFKKDLESAMNDDFNTSLAITHWIAFCKEVMNQEDLSKKTAQKILRYYEKVSRIFFGDLPIELPKTTACLLSKEEIESMIERRNKARKEKDFKQATQ